MLHIEGRVVGAEAVSRSFLNAGPAAHARIKRELGALGFLFVNYVKTQKLTGQVLNRRTGRLASSVNTEQTETPTAIVQTSGTKVWYGRYWEFMVSKIIEAKYRRALYWQGARHPVKRVFQRGPRPWLLPAFEEFRPRVRLRLIMALQAIDDAR